MLTFLALATLSPAHQAEKFPLHLLTLSANLAPTSDQLALVRSPLPDQPGLLVTINPGKEDYPGIGIAASGNKPWNLSDYGHVEAKVFNTGKRTLQIALRVDNAGDWHDNPWNTESITLAPGASGKIQTVFGYAYGQKPGYKLDPAKVTRILLFASKSDEVQSFRIESVVAAGPKGEKPPVAPDDVRTKPKDGLIPAPAGNIAVSPTVEAPIRLPIGSWDLRDFDALRVTVRNAGASPARARLLVRTKGGNSEWTTSPTPIPPGAKGEVTLPFAGTAPLDLLKRTGGSQITTDAVTQIDLAADREATFTIERVQAVTLTAPNPSWLGKRPPVPGNWTQTLREEFNGPKLNPKIWSIYGENYWDKSSHWSKDNVLLGHGVVRLRYTKKRGPNNDDPAKPESPYASGYLHTYGLWTQRYGYFEARMKLPKAPGLWPAFWMMPDRGVKAGEQWQRQDTANGGMEFDIFEHLTRWGGRRTNVAVHYDGYDKDHKSIGSDKIYVQPDKDGYIVAGLLWLPGSAVWYMNGREVARWDSPRVSNVPGILMFTLPQGGWDNAPIDDSQLPDDFTIDYVRAWQKAK